MTSAKGRANYNAKRRAMRAQEKDRKLRIASKQDSKESLRLLELEIKRLKKQVVDEAVIREEIMKISHSKPSVPAWDESKRKPSKNCPGVPTIVASDWHWGERVNPAAIGGVNRYDLTIAHARAKAFTENSIDLLKNHMVNPSYPGIVLALAGDMLSGDIHEELRETNDVATIPALVDLWGVLVGVIKRFADEFGHVFVPCVVGNHGRNTAKLRHKDRVGTSYDWLLYTLLDKAFESDPRVRFLISNGTDVSWKVFGHRFCMCHGDQFRGGDGMIGFLGPLTRGDKKKRARAGAIGQEYDTLILGHFHSLMMDHRRITNGSLVGYNEFAWSNNFEFEVPQQAMFLVNPVHGITFQIPIKVDKGSGKTYNDTEWVSWRR